ncbi:MAG: hypothetical protein K0R83_1376 [Caulobacter sp.]|jgi:hypothetical protein|nr:hypothetical protein [Caulobacter sp.]
MLLTLFLLFQASTTTCDAVGQQVICRTVKEPEVNWNVPRERPVVVQPPPPQPMRQWYRRPKEEAPTTAQVVGGLLSDGDCDGAVDTALKAGDLALAKAAKDFCVAK